MAHEIDIQIRKDGSLAFGVKGMKGRGCKEITKFLEELGLTTSQEATPEYYEVEEETSDDRHIHVEKR
jgi:hypothetical protein